MLTQQLATTTGEFTDQEMSSWVVDTHPRDSEEWRTTSSSSSSLGPLAVDGQGFYNHSTIRFSSVAALVSHSEEVVKVMDFDFRSAQEWYREWVRGPRGASTRTVQEDEWPSLAPPSQCQSDDGLT